MKITQFHYHQALSQAYKNLFPFYKLDLKLGDSEIELFSFPNAPVRPSYPEARGLRHLAFEVDNIDEAIAELNLHGIECEPIRIDEFTGKRFTFFEDPDKLPLELYER